MITATYTPKPLLGLSFMRIAPVEVEFLGYEALGQVRIRVPVAKNALLNVLAKIPEAERKETFVERVVPTCQVQIHGGEVDPADPHTLRAPRSAEALAEIRRQSVAERPLAAGAAFTCDTCTSAPRCLLAFDPYNTDGDCLWEK